MQSKHPPKAYSYQRFSTPEQAKGDSTTRQTLAAQRWCERHGIELDTELTFSDEGVSAFEGANAQKGALGDFLRAVENGDVPKGSYLLVESLDRISRQSPHKAVRLIGDIIEQGVTVVDLSDNEKEYSEETLQRDNTAPCQRRKHIEVLTGRSGAGAGTTEVRQQRAAHQATHKATTWMVVLER